MPATTQAEAPPLKKFHSNNIFSELHRAANGAEGVAALRETICTAVGTSQVKLARWLSNNSQPSLAEVAVVAQVLGTTVDSLIRYDA